VATSREPPPRTLPIVYLAIGHVSLVMALLVPALEPASIDSWFFHARMFFAVHLLTLGWITHSIIGATYLAAPMAMRMALPAGKLDGWICAFVVIGASGVVAHFWLNTYSGIGWSGVLLLTAFLAIAVRVWSALRKAGAPAPARLGCALAYFNLLLTAVLGMLLAINKHNTILPGDHLQDVYAHAHVGLVGWALLMVVSIGSRLLPMYLPAKPAEGPITWAPVVLLETGVIGFAVARVYAPELARWGAVAMAAGVGAFLLQVVGMLRRRLPAPKKMHRPDFGMLIALQGLIYLLAAVGTGLYVVFAERFSAPAVMVYGTFALLGFLGQIILGIAMRLLPMFAWLQAWTGSDFKQLPTSPHEMPSRPLQLLSLLLWTGGVPTLAAGLATASHRTVSTGAWLLIAGSLAAAISTGLVLRHAYRRA